MNKQVFTQIEESEDNWNIVILAITMKSICEN